jgi:hypothetical protein
MDVKMEDVSVHRERGPGPVFVRGLTMENVKASGRVRQLRGLEQSADVDFASSFNWNTDVRLYEEEKSKSPSGFSITAIFEQIQNCPNFTINFHGPVNF